VLLRFLAKTALNELCNFNLKYNIDKISPQLMLGFIKFAENLLTGHIGTASAKY
jgi:hypothetical protein